MSQPKQGTESNFEIANVLSDKSVSSSKLQNSQADEVKNLRVIKSGDFKELEKSFKKSLPSCCSFHSSQKSKGMFNFDETKFDRLLKNFENHSNYSNLKNMLDRHREENQKNENANKRKLSVNESKQINNASVDNLKSDCSDISDYQQVLEEKQEQRERNARKKLENTINIDLNNEGEVNSVIIECQDSKENPDSFREEDGPKMIFPKKSGDLENFTKPKLAKSKSDSVKSNKVGPKAKASHKSKLNSIKDSLEKDFSELDDHSHFEHFEIKLKPPRHKLKNQFIIDVYNVFFTFFTVDSYHEPIQFSNPSIRRIFYSFLDRKFNLPRQQTTEESLSFSLEYMNELLGMTTKKRPEECYKYILTRILKYLKLFLSTEKNAQIDNDFFYKYYFQNEADKFSIDIHEFYYPFSKNANKTSKMNAKYFEKLRLSENFTRDSKIYVDHFFYDDHSKEVNKKLVSMLKTFDLKMSEGLVNEESVVTQIIEYIANNSHCKFPWTLKETREAVAKFKATVFLENT